MARIRSIKPEFWTSAQVIECSTNARLLFVGLWNFCDDTGRHPANTKQVKASVFPADDISLKDVQRMLDELSTNGLITYYQFDNVQYFYVNGWHHQKIDRPQKAKYPSPFDERSSSIRRSFVPDRIGEEKIGEERKKDAAPNGAHPKTEEAELYERGKSVLGNNAGGLIARLLKSKKGSIPLARAAIEQASTKQDPREYIGAAIRGPVHERHGPNDPLAGIV